MRAADSKRAHARGLAQCGVVASCPVCSPKIMKARGEEIVRVVQAAKADGWDVVLVTFTLRHDRTDSIAELIDGLRAADKALNQDRQWREWRDASSFAGQLCRLEVTHGKNGAHPHLHKLMFFKRFQTDGQLWALHSHLDERWRHCVSRLVGASYEPSTEYAVDVRRGTTAGWYLVKLGLELASSFSKSAKNGNRSTWQLAQDVAEYARPRDVAIWREYVQAMKGKRHVTWSGARSRRHDVRGQLGLLKDGRPDEDLATEEAEDVEHVSEIPSDLWRYCARLRKGFHLEVLQAAERAGEPGVDELIRGILKHARGKPGRQEAA